jgi:uncharacterized protein (UPF0335 family)
MPSVQLANYLQARADGATVEEAAEQSGIGLGEAVLHEADIESGELELPRACVQVRATRGPTIGRDEDGRRANQHPCRRWAGSAIDLNKDIDDPANADAKEAMGTMFGKPASDTGQRLKLYIERAERLDEEIKGLNSDKSDLFKEMKSDGFDTPTIKRIIKLRKMETHTRQEAEALLSTYMDALGMSPIEAAIALAA